MPLTKAMREGSFRRASSVAERNQRIDAALVATHVARRDFRRDAFSEHAVLALRVGSPSFVARPLPLSAMGGGDPPKIE